MWEAIGDRVSFCELGHDSPWFGGVVDVTIGLAFHSNFGHLGS